MPTDFYYIIGEEDQSSKESAPEEVTSADVGLGRCNTRQAVRKRVASTLGRGVKIIDPASEENESSDGESLCGRKRQATGKTAVRVDMPGAPGAVPRDWLGATVKIVKRRIKLPS